jgi:hypothetical protein
MGRLDVHIRHGGGPEGGPWVALAVVLVLAAAGGAARGAISAAADVLVTVLEVIGWTLAGLAGAAVLGGGALAGVRIRRAVRAARARRVPPPVITITPHSPARPVPGAGRPALDPPRLRAAGSWQPASSKTCPARRRPAARSRRYPS